MHPLASYKAEKKEDITTCYIAGSGWLTRNFKEYMAHELRLNIEPLHYHKSLGIKFPFAGTNDELVFINVIGFLLRYINKVSLKGLNLRRTPKAIAMEDKDRVSVITLLQPIIKSVAIALTFFVVYIFVHNAVLDKSISKYRTQIDSKFKVAFPDKEKKTKDALLQNYSKLYSEINSRFKADRTLVESSSSKNDSALAALVELSDAIPKTIPVDILDLNIDSKGVKIISALTPLNENIKEIVSVLEKSGKFKNVKPGNVKPATDGLNREFDMSMVYSSKD